MLSLTFKLARVNFKPPVDLLQGEGPASPDEPYLFEASGYLYRGSSSKVFRGTLRPADPNSNADVMDAVCKYVDSDDDDVDIAPLEQEAGLYVGKLQRLQGRSVPHFYGLFKASYTTSSGRKREVACIMLEYFHSNREWDLWDGPLEARENIAKAMMAIHQAGVYQGDFDDDNVLVSDNGEVCIVDFDQAREHDCRCVMKVTVFDYAPSKYHFGCNELYDAVQLLDLWTPVWFPFSGFGGTFCIFDAPDADTLVELAGPHALITFADKEKAKEFVQEQAQETLNDYYETYREHLKHVGHPMDIKKERDALLAAKSS